MLYGDLAADEVSRLHLFESLSYFMSVMGSVLVAAAGSYFVRDQRRL